MNKRILILLGLILAAASLKAPFDDNGPFQRASGILFPVFSLPSKYGIGAFDQEAYTFVDQVAASGQKYWQILPLTDVNSDHYSPYFSHSAFAGNPLFIDLDKLVEKGWLTTKDIESFSFGGDPNYVDYNTVMYSKTELLKIAFKNSKIADNADFKNFVKNTEWLEDYALYMSLRELFGNRGWDLWENESLRRREQAALDEYKKKLANEILFHEFCQFEFEIEWKALKAYANQKGVKIIGDLPIYVALDSADLWVYPNFFQLDQNLKPVAVSGVPPDGFSATGQLWGNPLYNWGALAADGFSWWIKRMARCFEMYDTLRIDHFRGFESYFSIPAGAQDATGGHWEQGPGYAFFEKMKQDLGEKSIIVEDLGYLTEGVFELVRRTGWPGMKILQFAFGSDNENMYLPHKYIKNCIAFTGTHDNDSTLNWYRTINQGERGWVDNYAQLYNMSDEDKVWKLIELVMGSVANMVVIPLQDYLTLGGESRINNPATPWGNWKWRLQPGRFTEDVQHRIRDLTQRVGR